MAQSNLDPKRTVQLLMKDALSTLGESIRAEVLAVAASVERNARDQMLPVEASEYGEAEEGSSLEEAQRFFDREVVDQFQQSVHDQHLDTTWPACPRHPNHPLRSGEDSQAWCCPRDGAPVAPLGGLADVVPPAA
jgi:hypothetical protein